MPLACNTRSSILAPLSVALRAALISGCLAALPARAQTPMPFVAELPDDFDRALPAPVALLASHGMGFVTSEVESSRVVKGAPYSAEAVSEITQVLMDGNRIQRRSVQRLARDGEGRTRVERLRRDGTVESVVINDVVAGKRYWLLPDKKRAIDLAAGGLAPRARLAPPAPRAPSAAPVAPVPPVPPTPTPPEPPGAMTGEEARSWAEEMRRWARELAARWRVEQGPGADADGHALAAGEAPPARVIVREARSGEGDGRSVDVDVVRVIEAAHDASEAATAALAELPPVPTVPGLLGRGVTTSLGSKEFDRVRADGSRTTWTIAAGRIGNDKPIEVVSERWYSPDLLLVVSARRFDPRSGETTYRLTGLKRGEPEATLFQVPADYERRARGARRDDPAAK